MNRNWIIKAMDEKHRQESLDFVERVFAVSDGEEEGKLVRNLVEEIRSKKYYLPELELIECRCEKAKEMGYEAVLVEGDPRNYNPRGFETSCNYGMIAGEEVSLPAPECLMVKELKEGALGTMKGILSAAYAQGNGTALCRPEFLWR